MSVSEDQDNPRSDAMNHDVPSAAVLYFMYIVFQIDPVF